MVGFLRAGAAHPMRESASDDLRKFWKDQMDDPLARLAQSHGLTEQRAVSRAD